MPSVSRRVLVRVGLASLSCLAVVALSSWDRSSLPIADRLAELALCVLAWEASVPLCATLLRHRRLRIGADGSPLRLAATVVVASLPARVGMAAVFRFLGEPIAVSLATYDQSLLLGLLLAFARRGLMRERPAPAVATATPAATPVASPAAVGQALLRRHAPRLAGHRLLALEAEDHYVRFHTEAGSALVLMRLRDAVAALGPEA